MFTSWLFQNAQIPGRSGHQQILLEDGQVTSIAPQQNIELGVDLRILDVAGDWISLGGVDLQINGALGLAFPDLTIENAHQLNHIGRFLWGNDQYD
jgi:N-acetylglucosamine-6-phosphate deacetylase